MTNTLLALLERLLCTTSGEFIVSKRDASMKMGNGFGRIDGSLVGGRRRRLLPSRMKRIHQAVSEKERPRPARFVYSSNRNCLSILFTPGLVGFLSESGFEWKDRMGTIAAMGVENRFGQPISICNNPLKIDTYMKHG